MTVSVLLVDDQPLLRMAFSMLADSQPDLTVVGEAGDGAEAVALAARLRPDVVLMDVRMPGMDGIEATAHIVAAHPDTRVLILTTFDLDEYAFAALRAGASGFLLKNARPDELLSAVRVVAAGEAVVAPRMTRRLLDALAGSLPSPTPAAPALATLTARERDVLALLARARSNAEIAAELSLSEGTVKTHVSRVLTKLDLRDRVQAVVFAYENHLVTPG